MLKPMSSDALAVMEWPTSEPTTPPSNRISIGRPMRSVSQCAACAPFRDRYRESLLPIKLWDTGEIVGLGASCAKRLFTRIMEDKGVLDFRQPGGDINRMRRVLIVDLSAKYKALGLVKGSWTDETNFVKRNDAQDDLIVTADEFRLYLQQDILERLQAERDK